MEKDDDAELFVNRMRTIYRNATMVTFIDEHPNRMLVFFPPNKDADILRIQKAMQVQYSYTFSENDVFYLPNAIGVVLPAQVIVGQSELIESPEASWFKSEALRGNIVQLHCETVAQYHALREDHLRRATVALNQPGLN